MALSEYDDTLQGKKERLEKAIEERDKLLKKYPHLREAQAEIDDILSKTAKKDRIEVLFIMLGAKLGEMNELMSKLATEKKAEGAARG